ncbi:hypothetical protein CC80DRAFT_70023 [Byssothecium circinans]|uniref:SUZ domain-containing protein n=1 Tax=Byssothecium circinans TaxID=147558 RepID=A0A6A5U4U9_9PLEO|nr:hypothetical protein CC80DRAFT_70023 [Byssothecium circinans]
MPPKTAVVDAWDDDWESVADRQDENEKKGVPAPPAKLTKAERRAQHAELNRQIWQSAENPEPLLFLEARNTIPVQPTFKPTMTVLARKPPQLLSRNAEEDDDDSEEERRKKSEADYEERKARAQRERAEKERRYAEAREKIFGSPQASDESRGASPHKQGRGGKGRGRGGRDSQNRSNEQSPARPPAAGRQLYEPSYSPKPGSAFVHKKESSTSRPSTPNGLEKPIREPRGPQAGVRGGRGFAPRGNHLAGNVS